MDEKTLEILVEGAPTILGLVSIAWASMGCIDLADRIYQVKKLMPSYCSDRDEKPTIWNVYNIIWPAKYEESNPYYKEKKS
ncbi:MAG: hypothetical protein ACI83O_000422 [Patescibacteria group bacterium]|jgi:hypothetical protein